MRDIVHKTSMILHGRGKVITLREHAEEEETITDVRKNFIYLGQEAQGEEVQSLPRVHITRVRTADRALVTVATFLGPVRYVLHDGSGTLARWPGSAPGRP